MKRLANVYDVNFQTSFWKEKIYKTIIVNHLRRSCYSVLKQLHALKWVNEILEISDSVLFYLKRETKTLSSRREFF